MLRKTIKQLIVLSLLLLVSLPAMAAEVIIDSDVYPSADIYTRKNMVVFITDQIGYVFYSDKDRNVVYKKTNDGGSSWAGKVTLFADAASVGVMIWYDRWTPGDIGTKVHLISVDDSENALHYAEFDVTNDTVSSHANISHGISHGLNDDNRYYITKATDGSLYAGLMDSSNKTFIRSCPSNCSTDLSWSDAAAQPFDGNDGDDIILMPLPAGNILALHWDISQNDIESSIYDKTSQAWSAEKNIDNDTSLFPNTAFSDAQDYPSYRSAWGATVNPNNGKIYFLYNSRPYSTSDYASHITLIYDPSSNTWSKGVYGNTDNYSVQPSIAFNPDTNDYYAVIMNRRKQNHIQGQQVYSQSCNDENLSPSCQPVIYGSSWNTQYNGISVNLVNTEKIYGVWYDNSGTQSLRGITVDNPVATSVAPAICLEPDPYDGFSAAKTTIDLSSDGTYNTPKGPSMVFTSTDIGYMFFVDDSNTNIVYRKTLDGGKTWSQRVTVANMSNTTKQLVVYYDKWTPGLTSNKIHLFIGTNNSKTNYIEFSPGADASTSSRTIYTGVNYDSYSTISGMISGEGKLYVTMSNTGGRLLSCSNDCAGSGTWTQVANYPYNDRHNWHELRLAPLKNDKLLVLHWDTLIGQPTTEHIFYSIYDPTLSTLSTFSPSADLGLAYDNIVTWPGAWGTTYNKSTDETYLCYNDHVYGNGYGNLGDIKTAVFDDSGLLRTGVAVNNEEGFQCDLAYDELTGDTYLIRSKEFVGDFDNEKVFMTKSSDGMVTWSNSIQVNIEAASDSDGGSNYRQIGMNVSSPDRIYAWLWELLPGSTYASASAKYYGVSVTENNGADRLNPNQSAADWFHFAGF